MASPWRPIATTYNIPAFTVDPLVVDDFCEVARLSGYAPVQRRSPAHVLSVRAMGRKAAAQLGKDFFQTRLVAVHLGGGTTVAALREGRLVDTNNALLGGGPFSPQRVGSLPMRDLMDLCYSGRFTKEALQTELTKRGGLISYLGEDNFPHIETRIAEGDRHADWSFTAWLTRWRRKSAPWPSQPACRWMPLSSPAA